MQLISQSVSSSAQGSELKIDFEAQKYLAPNGLTIILYEDHRIPMISYHTWYRVGSRNESPGVTGAAHMLEHMMFKGAKKYSGKDFDRILHENGIMNNAFTSWDYTGFYQNLPSSKLELMMDMEVDRMRYLKIDPSDLKSELQVVAEERRWRTDNNPMGLLREELFKKVFNQTPYEWPVIGHMSDIQSYTSEKLKVFYDKYYNTSNAVLVLAGDFDPDQVKTLIEKHYGQLLPAPVEKQNFKAMVLPSKPQRSLIHKSVQNATLMFAYPSVSAKHQDTYALEILGHILGGGLSSPLVTELVYTKQIASSAGSFQLSNADSGLFGISVSVKPESNWQVAEQLVRGQIKAVLENGVSAKELEKAKINMMKEFVDDLQTLDGKARAIAVNEILFGDYKKLLTDLEKYQSVTVDDVKRVANDYLKISHETFVALLPEDKK